MKTRTNKRSIKNRRNTKKFRGGMGPVKTRRGPFNPGEFNLDEVGFGETVVGQPAGDSKGEDLEGPQTTTVDCTEERKKAMERAQVERKKGSTTRSSTVQDGMKLIENKKGRLKASEFNCKFHPNNGWKMTNGRRFGFKSSSCPDCERCINGDNDPPKTEDPQGDDQGNTPEVTPLSSEESNCGESAKKALKLSLIHI